MAQRLSTQTIVQASTITVAPVINDRRFQGYYIHSNGSLEAINCPVSSSLFTTSNFGVCCGFDASTCSTFWTTCAGSVPVGVSSDPCASGQSCNTVSIFDQFAANDGLVHSQIICAPQNWVAFSIYRTVVTTTGATTLFSTLTFGAATTSLVASTASNTGAVGNTQAASLTSNGIAPATTATSTIVPTPVPTSGSNAWIAGAVIGPLLALALIGLLIWIVRRRRSRSRRAPQMNTMASKMGSPRGYAHVPNGMESSPATYHQDQAYHQDQPYEMGSSRIRDEGPHELPESKNGFPAFHDRPS